MGNSTLAAGDVVILDDLVIVQSHLGDHPDDYADWPIEVIDGVRWHVSPPDSEGVEGQTRVLCAEEPEPLWGPGGPEKGQVITIAGTSMQTRWNGHSWERVG